MPWTPNFSDARLPAAPHGQTACIPGGGGGVLPMGWVIHMCRGFDPLFSLWQDRAWSFWGIFSHPPTPKRSFVVLKLPILTELDLLGPKFHFSLDLFGSNFQRPAAHPHHFSDRVPPPGLHPATGLSKFLPSCIHHRLPDNSLISANL